jgi:enoyl-CoA hydratase
VIEREVVDGVSVVRMAHGKVNAFDVEFLAALRDTFRALDEGPYGGLVLTGSGRVFSAGVDLHRLTSGGVDYVTEFLRLLSEMFEALFVVERPVVAAVNGHALAGGFVLFSACDLRFLADGPARIGLPELRVGVPFPASALEIVRHPTGAGAQRLVATADTFTPQETVAHGWADELVGADDLLPRAIKRARDLATKIPPATFALTKRQLRADAHERIRATRAAFEDDVVERWLDPESWRWIERYMNEVTGR